MRKLLVVTVVALAVSLGIGAYFIVSDSAEAVKPVPVVTLDSFVATGCTNITSQVSWEKIPRTFLVVHTFHRHSPTFVISTFGNELDHPMRKGTSTVIKASGLTDGQVWHQHVRLENNRGGQLTGDIQSGTTITLACGATD